MQLHTYRGKSIGEALSAVKRDLGPDALVVHTRSFKVGGVLGVGAREEVEILASRPPVAPTAPRQKPAAPTGRAVADRLTAAYRAARAETAAPTPPRPAPAATPSPAPRAVTAPPEVMQVRRRPATPAITAPETLPAVANVANIAIATPTTDVHGELGAIKLMVAQLLSSGAAPLPGTAPRAPAHDPLTDWYLRLLSNAVSRELAERIVADVRRQTANGAPDSQSLARAFRECIASYIPAAREPLPLPRANDPRPRTVALVGATGVGKTTTVAKLAAQAKLTHNARVGVITCDTNRIGAIEQLRTYADILSLPFRVAATPDEMVGARASLGDCDLLLVDTPGLSPKDEPGIQSLAHLLDRADLAEVHLALPASGAEATLLNACRAFAPLRPSRLLFTKLDEAVTYGVILSVAAQVRTELSYITTGPRIPEQIQAGDPTHLAELIAA